MFRGLVRKAAGSAFQKQARWCCGKKEVDIDAIAYGYMASQTLFAALDLKVFDVVKAAGKADLQTIQKGTNITSPRLLTLLTALTSHGMLERNSDGAYELTKNVDKFLTEDSKYYYGDYLKYQIGGQFYGRLDKLGKIMTTGEAPTYTSWFENPEEAKLYTNAQHNGSLATAKQLYKKLDYLSGVKDFLDVGGGSGAFSIIMSRNNPDLNATVLELPEVAEAGRKIVAQEEEDVAKRIKYIPGTALTNWDVESANYDCVLMSYLSGSVPEGLIANIYTEAYRALRPGGKLIIHDFMVDDSLDGPPVAALWAVQHIAVNADGLGLCPANVSEKMKEAGFTDIDASIEMIGGLTKVVVATKN